MPFKDSEKWKIYLKNYNLSPENKQRKKEYDRVYRLRPERKEYRSRTEIKEYHNEYNKHYGKSYRSKPESKAKKKEYQKIWSLIPENKERRKSLESTPERKAQRKEYRSSVEAKMKIKKWDDKHPDYRKEYNQTNPKIILKSQKKYLEKLGSKFNQSMFEYKIALRTWGKVIKNRDKTCVICGSTDKIEAHHIIHRSKYPELSFLENNGITLCKTHHYEVHGKTM